MESGDSGHTYFYKSIVFTGSPRSFSVCFRTRRGSIPVSTAAFQNNSETQERGLVKIRKLM